MAAGTEDTGRTFELAGAALAHMREHGNAATPRNYELWYRYVCRDHHSLTQAMNARLAESERLSEDDLAQLYDTYLSPERFVARAEAAGVQVQGEIERIVTTMDSARASADSYRAALGGIIDSLEPAEGARIGAIVTALAESTREMKRVNDELQERLTVSRAQLSALQDDMQAIRAESLTDPLTQLANRKGLDDFIAGTMARGEAFSLLLIDIDHFKGFNDRYGHLVGDQVLRVISSHLERSLSEGELAARFGGEEFAIVLPKASLADAMRLAERIRGSVAARELVRRSSHVSFGQITISVGVATWQARESSTSLFERADACLYLAKHGGRNRVISERQITPQQLAAFAVG
jgi:diguanylate cyclase